jgi:hypothetical protein
MGTLLGLYDSNTADMKNKIMAAGWRKAKEILLSVSPTSQSLQYAASLLGGDSPPNRVVHGALVVLEDNLTPTDEQIQSTVDTVVDKLIEAEG